MKTFEAKDLEAVVQALLETGAHRATRYHDPKRVLSAQRVLFEGRIYARDSRAVIVVKIGSPNYAERAFIKACQKAGERFPVKKIQLKFPSRNGH